ncbi:MAG: transcriptional repressor [Thermodesulfovibrionales bacterium]|nr:transcriptional repressor [Thermodesulfovibrionales bacterium]
MLRDFQTVLKKLHLKVTPKRLAILEILKNESVYLSPEEVWRKLRKQFSRVGLPTVYRNLEELAQGDVISKVTHPNRQLYYYFCLNPSHHHHFICLSCRTVEDIDFCMFRELEKRVKQELKGRVVSHILQVNGLCKKCLKKDGESHA